MKVYHFFQESEEDEYDMCEMELTQDSKVQLEQLAKKLLNQSTPCVVIFNSCYSYYSQINDVLISNGVFAALNLINDNTINADGKFIELSDHQRSILQNANKVWNINFSKFISEELISFIEKTSPFIWFSWNRKNNNLNARTEEKDLKVSSDEEEHSSSDCYFPSTDKKELSDLHWHARKVYSFFVNECWLQADGFQRSM